MARNGTMKEIEKELTRIQGEIARLRIEEATILRLLKSVRGETETIAEAPKKRAVNIKPLVLKIMEAAGTVGALSSEVVAKVQETNPNVTRDSISSILSRLKADGALKYDGERYYDTRYAPKDPLNPFQERLRAVN